MIEHFKKYTEGIKAIDKMALRCKRDLVYEIMADIQKTDGWQDDFELEHFNTEMNDAIILLDKQIEEME